MGFERTPLTLGVRFPPGALDAPVLSPERRDEVHRRLRALLPDAEVVVLATCQRTEATLVGVTPGEAITAWHAALELPLDSRPSCLVAPADPYVYPGLDALRHACRVACGLDSATLGETDIGAQLRAAHRAAEELGSLGPVTRRLLRAAFATAKTARATTGIGSAPRGASAAAAEVIDRRRPGSAVVVVGAGIAARGVVRHLARSGRPLTVLARDSRRASEVASAAGVASGSLDDLRDALQHADVLVAAIPGPSPLIADALSARRGDGDVLVIDMGAPPCVAPRPGVELVGLADLAGRAVDDRVCSAVPMVEALIDRACEGWLAAEATEGAVRSRPRQLAS